MVFFALILPSVRFCERCEQSGQEWRQPRSDRRAEFLLQLVGNGIVVIVDLNVIVDIHADLLPLSKLIGGCGQGLQGWTIQRFKGLLA